MIIKPLTIGELVANIPIIQGGMGIGVSRSGLAGAVAREGAIGVISGVQIGFDEPDFNINNKEANKRALKNEIKKAREKASGGILGVNLMVAMQDYKEMVMTAVEEGIDLIISGAGLPTELPSIIKGSKTKAIPIVSSGKAASVILKLWEKRWNYVPDCVVVEGPDAGGHLGFSPEQLEEDKKPYLSSIFSDVKAVINEYEEKFIKKISVVVAGGISNGKDIVKYLKEGADGVQMATVFIGTEECDAHLNYKEAYINAKEKDITITKSPVGMPGRAIRNSFINRISNENIPVKRCYDCLKPCNPATTSYCISNALIQAVKGNVSEGLLFTGVSGYKIDKIVTVKELINNLVQDIKKL